MSPTRVIAVVVAAVGCACLAFAAFGGDSSRAATTGQAPLGTPLWSPRRAPQTIVDGVGAQKLQAALSAATAGTTACFLVDAGGAPLAQQSADAALIPASTEKLATSAVALSVLGPDSHLETKVVAAKAPDNGSVDRLYLVGGGDPLLVTPAGQAAFDQDPTTRGNTWTSMAAFADAIVKAGVKRITAGIVADDSRYETLRYLPTWKTSYRTDGEIGPIGALTVDRGFSAFKPRPISVDDPAVFAAQQLGILLQARGVTVSGTPSRGNAPAGAVDVAKIESPALKDVVGEILRSSDNLGAEMLTREIGFRVAQQGTTAAGVKAIAAKLAALGLPTAGLALTDGSGLDRGDHLTCQLLAAVLDLGAQPQFGALWSGLGVAGQSGRLVTELAGTALDGKLRAKTGSLDGVSGLVGLIDVGRPLRFAFVANGSFTDTGGVTLRDRVATVIATFPQSPTADALVPGPTPGVKS